MRTTSQTFSEFTGTKFKAPAAFETLSSNSGIPQWKKQDSVHSATLVKVNQHRREALERIPPQDQV